MRSLSEREKRTIRLAAVLVMIYLAGVYGLKGWRYVEAVGDQYGELKLQVRTLNTEILRERAKAQRLANLKKSLRIDLERLRQVTAVAEAREAVFKAAQQLGVQLGPSRETQGRSAARELAVLHLEGQGQTPSVVHFVHSLKSLGYPLVLDRLQISAVPGKPGQVKLSLSVALLNYAAWKKPEKTSA